MYVRMYVCFRGSDEIRRQKPTPQQEARGMDTTTYSNATSDVVIISVITYSQCMYVCMYVCKCVYCMQVGWLSWSRCCGMPCHRISEN